MLLMAAVITVGVYVAKRDAQRDAERKYEFNVIQSIIKDVALYQEEIENWGYQVSAVMPDEEPEYEEVLKTVRLELAKRNRNQAPFEENLNEVGASEYYDILVELNVKTFSIDGGKTIWVKSGFWCTNYCSNNFVDCMRFGIGEVDTEGNSRAADCHIKQEYSAEQLLAFYQQGLDLQKRLIELYKRRHEISHSSTETGYRDRRSQGK